MNKYQDFPVDSRIYHGDRVTFSSPREGESMTMFAGKHANGRMVFLALGKARTTRDLREKGMTVSRIERPVS